MNIGEQRATLRPVATAPGEFEVRITPRAMPITHR